MDSYDCPAIGQCNGYRLADAAAAAGDQRRYSGKIYLHRQILSHACFPVGILHRPALSYNAIRPDTETAGAFRLPAAPRAERYEIMPARQMSPILSNLGRMTFRSNENHLTISSPSTLPRGRHPHALLS